MKFFVFLSCFLFCISGFCQKIQFRAYVYSAADSTAIEAASVYFDGSTLGTITNAQGIFSIQYPASISNPLVISAMGYETIFLNPDRLLDFQQKDTPVLYLKESTEQLAAVQLETDPWSRKRKMKAFKKEFLGSSSWAARCKILNDTVLDLRYSPSSQKLVASANAALIVTNKALGYEIHYDLYDFYINYDSGTSGLVYPTATYYAGTSFFKPLHDRLRRKTKRNRNTAYLGSLLHFMRSLARKTLRENDFRMFYEGFETPPYKFFDIKVENNRTHIVLKTKELNILYNNEEQSVLQTRSDFYIDEWGNHSPPDAVLTGGVMGRERIAELVPIDYEIKD